MGVLKSIIKRGLKFTLYIFLFLFMTFTICEIWFRLEPETLPAKYFKNRIEARLWNVWLNKQNSDVLFPPFKIFSNTDLDNIERLRFIVKETSLPRNTKLRSYDFLRQGEIKEKTYYIATINNLGFRDPPRTIQKPKNVFRIIVLGSYHAFGHAVNDEDTYPRQLERILNNLGLNNIIFEVWNGGRHAASAIVGLARLKTEILDYQPDLIIWDYGFVDVAILGDNNLPPAFLFPNSGIYRPLAWLCHLTKNIIAGKSVTFIKFQDYLFRKNCSKNVENFLKVNKRMLEITKQNSIPVILLRQSIVTDIRPAFYQKLSDEFDHVIFVDGNKIFEKYPPPPEVVRRFHSEENWLSEYNPELEKVRKWRPPEYFKDIFQYNEWGHKAIAEYLADKIKIFVKEHCLKNQQYKLRGE